MAFITPFLSSRKEKAGAKILIGLPRTAQKLCNCLKNSRLTGTCRSVKPEKRWCRTFAMDPVYNNLSNGLASIRVTIWRREAFGRVMNCSERNSLSKGMKPFIIGSSIRILFRTDMKSCIPYSRSPLLIVRPPCPELNIPPWIKTFEECAILQLVTWRKWSGERKTDWTISCSLLLVSTALSYASAQQYPKCQQTRLKHRVEVD